MFHDSSIISAPSMSFSLILLNWVALMLNSRKVAKLLPRSLLHLSAIIDWPKLCTKKIEMRLILNLN